MAGTPVITVVITNLATSVSSASGSQYISSVPITTPRLKGRMVIEHNRMASKSCGESMLCHRFA
jgi:hypothetical protein